MKKKALARQWFCWYLGRMSFVLLMAGIAVPAMAILSGTTEQIQGQAPMVSGYLQVLLPDGETVLLDNTLLELGLVPNQFRASPSTEGLVLQDADGDAGLAASVDIEHAILSWKHDGTALTSTQLAAPFRDNFAGQTLTLEVSAPITASSTTGLPTTAEPRLLTNTYTLDVPLPEIAPGNFIVASGAVADGIATNTLSATVKDARGNLLENVDVTFTVTGGAATPVTQTKPTNHSGVAQAELVSTVAGDNQVTATVGSQTTAAKTSTFMVFVGTATIDGNQQVFIFPRTFSIDFKPDEGYAFDDTCLTIKGSIKPLMFNYSTNVSGWGDTSLTYNTAGHYNWTLTVSNSCGKPISGTVVTQLFRENEAAEKQYFPVSIKSQGGKPY